MKGKLTSYFSTRSLLGVRCWTDLLLALLLLSGEKSSNMASNGVGRWTRKDHCWRYLTLRYCLRVFVVVRVRRARQGWVERIRMFSKSAIPSGAKCHSKVSEHLDDSIFSFWTGYAVAFDFISSWPCLFDWVSEKKANSWFVDCSNNDRPEDKFKQN